MILSENRCPLFGIMLERVRRCLTLWIGKQRRPFAMSARLRPHPAAVHIQAESSIWSRRAIAPRTQLTLCRATIEAAYEDRRDFSANKRNNMKDAHNKAAEHHESAAKSHRSAAEAHGNNDHAKGKEHSNQAQQHAQNANEHSKTAHGKSTQQK